LIPTNIRLLFVNVDNTDIINALGSLPINLVPVLLGILGLYTLSYLFFLSAFSSS
jgi:hypothetical protein